MTVMNRVRWLIMPRTHHTSIRPSISPSLAPKTSLWSLVATLMHTFEFGYQQNERYTTGCASICESTRFMVNGSCTGVGCCEVDIPKGLKNVTMESRSFQNHNIVEYFNPCGYAFISKQDTFNFSTDSLRTLRDQQMMPMVLDWAIGNETCNDVENKSNYICGDNSSCQNSEDSSGYRCKCKDGYDGNPYLPNGCLGINLCIYYLPSPI